MNGRIFNDNWFFSYKKALKNIKKQIQALYPDNLIVVLKNDMLAKILIIHPTDFFIIKELLLYENTKKSYLFKKYNIKVENL